MIFRSFRLVVFRLVFATILSPFLGLTSVGAAAAHEFWLEPYAYRIESGDAIIGNAKTGQTFKGYRHLYLPKRFTRFDIFDGVEIRPIDGVVGDVPILNTAPKRGGLHVVSYLSAVQTVDFEDWAVFADYLDDEGLPNLRERHVARGLDPNGFTEAFIRCAKSLIAVGDGLGMDRAVGLPLELVAVESPYTGSIHDGMRVRLLWLGKPLPDAQIKILHRREDEPASRQTIRTDPNGEADIPFLGQGAYLLNAVRLIENDDPPWLSYWASLTYGVAD